MTKKGGASYTTTQALQNYKPPPAEKPEDDQSDKRIEDLEEIHLQFSHPPITTMTDRLQQLTSCKRLYLSTNNISDIGPMPQRIEILSIGRNSLTNLKKIDRAASTLTELWASYNQIKDITPLAQCKKLRVVYLAYNKLNVTTSVDPLAQLPALEDLLLTGNECVGKIQEKTKNYRAEMVKKCKKLTILDGKSVTPEDRGETTGVAGGDTSQKNTTGTGTANASGAASSGNGSRAVSPRPN